MKKIHFDYGRNGLIINAPNHTTEVRTTVLNPLKNEPVRILEALRNPINRAPLKDLVDEQTRVVITHSDITRATPNDRLLPVILKELEDHGVKKKNITLLNALGTHRPQTEDELRSLLGDWIFENYRCQQHNAFDNSGLVSVGKTKFGNDIRLNRLLIDSDLKIFTGFIEPHFFAGYSGGPKAVLPALSGAESVFSNHGYKMVDDPSATFNITEGNPIWEEMKEAAGMVDNAFLVNVTLDRDHQITGVFAGDVIQAHAKGVQFLRKSSIVSINEPYDVVITSNSGYPLDQNLYQCVKGLSAAKRAVRKGGAILMLAECEDGLPDHGAYADLLKQAGSPDGILEMVSQPNFKHQDSWQVQTQAYVQQKAKVYLYSDGLRDDQIRDAMLEPCRDIDKTIHQLAEEFGDRICAIPEGPLVIVDMEK